MSLHNVATTKLGLIQSPSLLLPKQFMGTIRSTEESDTNVNHPTDHHQKLEQPLAQQQQQQQQYFEENEEETYTPQSKITLDFDNHRYIEQSTKPTLKLAKHLYVLPVLFLEFLALALTRAIIPTLLLHTFTDHVYLIMGFAECVRGILAFISCPLFGKLSDILGRKVCLFITVLGTCTPICTYAIMTYWDHSSSHISPSFEIALTHRRIWVFILLLSLSGLFSSTFTLTFAYISDTVKQNEHRVAAYGLALATFGMSFTIGPMTGGYLARVDGEKTVYSSNEERMDNNSTTTWNDFQSSSTNRGNYVPFLGQERVFTASLLLTILDLIYIYFILPESNDRSMMGIRPTHHPFESDSDDEYGDDEFDRDSKDDFYSHDMSDSVMSPTSRWDYIRRDILPNAWKPIDTLKIFTGDPLMYQVGIIALFYYTSLWAVVSTLIIYAAKRFHLGPDRLGELISALGLCTMVSEAVLVRIVVPALGEKRSVRVGLASFMMQCIILALAYEGWQLFICVLLSMVGNLVYPSLTSLVTGAVSPDMVGTALGAINGVKAFTEGLGPLVFGTLMTMSEKSILPGWPYLIAAVFAYMAYSRASQLPDENDDEYISEKYFTKIKRTRAQSLRSGSKSWFEMIRSLARHLDSDTENRRDGSASALSRVIQIERDAEEDDCDRLLSEVEESSDADL